MTNLATDIKPIGIAATIPIFGFDLTPRFYELEKAKKALQELKITHPQSLVTNVVGDYHSPWESHLLNPNLAPICKLVETTANEIWKFGFNDARQEANADFKIEQCWFAVYGDGGYAKSHHHFPFDLACVLYIDADEQSSPLVLGNGVQMPAKKNFIYFFPGILQHEVRPSKGSRTALAMNLDAKKWSIGKKVGF